MFQNILCKQLNKDEGQFMCYNKFQTPGTTLCLLVHFRIVYHAIHAAHGSNKLRILRSLNVQGNLGIGYFFQNFDVN